MFGRRGFRNVRQNSLVQSLFGIIQVPGGSILGPGALSALVDAEVNMGSLGVLGGYGRYSGRGKSVRRDRRMLTLVVDHYEMYRSNV